MVAKYGMEISKEKLAKEFLKIIDQIFKLLPEREEGKNWEAPLQNLIIEVVGFNNLLGDEVDLLPVIAKLEGMLTLTGEQDFLRFRSNVFECCGFISKVKKLWD